MSTRSAVLFALLALVAAPVAATPPAPAGAGVARAGADPPEADALGLEFSEDKREKTYGLNVTSNGIKTSDAVQFDRDSHGYAFEGARDDSGGFATTPLVGEGEWTVEVTLGFLTLAGILANQSLAGVEVDLLNSNPLRFLFLGIFWAQGQMWAFAQSENGNLGSPVALGVTLFATLRIVQTANSLFFYARAAKLTNWLLVASLGTAPWNGFFQVGFGVNNLQRGARVVFDYVRAWGPGLFGAAVIPLLAALQGFYGDLSAISCALLYDGNTFSALTTLAILLGSIDQFRLGVLNAGRAGDFLTFVLWQNALRFLAKAYKSGMKMQSFLDRGDLLKAIAAFALLQTYLRLADFSLRGMGVRRGEELLSFFPFDRTQATANAALPGTGAQAPEPPRLGALGLRGA